MVFVGLVKTIVFKWGEIFILARCVNELQFFFFKLDFITNSFFTLIFLKKKINYSVIKNKIEYLYCLLF